MWGNWSGLLGGIDGGAREREPQMGEVSLVGLWEVVDILNHASVEVLDPDRSPVWMPPKAIPPP